VTATAPAATRYPVRHHADGDFTTAEILAAAAGARIPEPVPAPGLAQAALAARLWRLDGTDGLDALAGHPPGARNPTARLATDPDEAEIALLRAFETAPLWTVPVGHSTAGLGHAAARAWLRLAAHWAALAGQSGDLRFLNTACKLLGAAWTRHRESAQAPAGLRAEAAAAAQAIEAASAGLTRLLADRVIPAGGPGRRRHGIQRPAVLARAGEHAPAIVLLAAAGSGTARRLAAEAASAGVPLSRLCWYSACEASPPGDSAYAQAWYPPEAGTPARDSQVPPGTPQVTARNWGEAAAALRGADLVILAGMPVVPAPVLETARLGVINAHNGTLPGYRGMDAVGWALLNGDRVACTAHVVRPAVDAGEVIADLGIPPAPVGTLCSRVKAAQVSLLLDAATFTARHGRLPDATPQPAGAGRHYYRLHPHLKRLLDASPYGRTGNDSEGAHAS
jgi:hypothetical protein